MFRGPLVFFLCIFIQTTQTNSLYHTWCQKALSLWVDDPANNKEIHWLSTSLSLIHVVRFMGPTWGPSGADRTHVGPMLLPWTLLSGMSNILPPPGITSQTLSNNFYVWHRRNAVIYQKWFPDQTAVRVESLGEYCGTRALDNHHNVDRSAHIMPPCRCLML